MQRRTGYEPDLRARVPRVVEVAVRCNQPVWWMKLWPIFVGTLLRLPGAHSEWIVEGAPLEVVDLIQPAGGRTGIFASPSFLDG